MMVDFAAEKAEGNQVDLILPHPLCILLEVQFFKEIGEPWFGGHLIHGANFVSPMLSPARQLLTARRCSLANRLAGLWQPASSWPVWAGAIYLHSGPEFLIKSSFLYFLKYQD